MLAEVQERAREMRREVDREFPRLDERQMLLLRMLQLQILAWRRRRLLENNQDEWVQEGTWARRMLEGEIQGWRLSTELVDGDVLQLQDGAPLRVTDVARRWLTRRREPGEAEEDLKVSGAQARVSVVRTLRRQGLESRWQEACAKWRACGGKGRTTERLQTLTREWRKQQARERLLRMQRAFRRYFQVGSLSGAPRDAVPTVFNFEFEPRRGRARRRRRREDDENFASGAAPNEHGEYKIDRVLAVLQRKGASGHMRWFAVVRWQGYDEFGYEDDEVPVYGPDSFGAQLNAGARADAQRLIRESEVQKRSEERRREAERGRQAKAARQTKRHDRWMRSDRGVAGRDADDSDDDWQPRGKRRRRLPAVLEEDD